jgi:hypothetical protein
MGRGNYHPNMGDELADMIYLELPPDMRDEDDPADESGGDWELLNRWVQDFIGNHVSGKVVKSPHQHHYYRCDVKWDMFYAIERGDGVIVSLADHENGQIALVTYGGHNIIPGIGMCNADFLARKLREAAIKAGFKVSVMTSAYTCRYLS